MSRIRDRLTRVVLPPPPGCEDGQYSLILPADRDPPSSRPTASLMELCASAIGHAREVDLTDLSARMKAEPRWPDIWPGEHYKLLAGFVRAMQPRTIVEIGTFTGLSALALKKHLPPGAVVTTFDVRAWTSFEETCLRREDFEDGQLVQCLGDLSDKVVIREHAARLARADLIFVDAPKDGVFEPRFLENLEQVAFETKPLLILDDIRLWNMLGVWRAIKRPKIDLTSFGHWSGTGVISWNGR